MKRITIIVPCYNEAESLMAFYEEIKKHMENPKYQFELLFVNDGSKDDTLLLIRELAKKDSMVSYLSFSRNFGKEAAMYAGLVKSKNRDAVVFIDADLQHPPYIIDEMIKYWEEGYKLIYTKFNRRQGESIFKRFCVKVFYHLFRKFSAINLEESVKDFQFLDKKVIDAYLAIPDHNRFLKGMYGWVGFQKKCISFDYVERKNGKTSWNFMKLLKYGFDGINQYSKILMFFPLLGIFFVLLVEVADIVLFVLTQCKVAPLMDLTFFLTQSQLNLYMLILLGLIYFLFYLMYQTRLEVLSRPIYLIEEESDSLMDVENDHD